MKRTNVVRVDQEPVMVCTDKTLEERINDILIELGRLKERLKNERKDRDELLKEIQKLKEERDGKAK